MKKLKQLLAITGLLVAASSAGMAQSYDGGRFGSRFLPYDATFNLQAGYRNTNLNQLNRALNVNGIPSVSGNDIWYGVSVERLYKQRINTELAAAFTGSSASEVNGIKARYYQSQLVARLGYNLTPGGRQKLYPFVGLNFGNANLNIKDNNGIDNSGNFNSTILARTANKTINQFNFGLEFGGGYAYAIPLGSRQAGDLNITRTLPVSLRAGYYLQLTSGDWNFYDRSIAGGPDQKNSGFFATLSVGLGVIADKRQ